MTEKTFVKTQIYFYILIILLIGCGGLYILVSFYKKTNNFNVPLLITIILSFIGSVTGIIRIILKWNRGKEDYIERFT